MAVDHEHRIFRWNGILPTWKKHYQKNTKGDRAVQLVFKPTDYKVENSKKRLEMAYEDAKNHERFYKQLIKEKLFPPKTTVKVKRMRHSNSYHLEFHMPHIPYEFGDEVEAIRKDPGHKKEDERLPEHKANTVKYRIQRIARERGYDYHNFTFTVDGPIWDQKMDFSTDMNYNSNYRFDKDGRCYYIDSEILEEKLPYKNRKKSHVRIISEMNEEEFNKRRHTSSLENKLTSVILISSIVISVLFFSSNITGNAIVNLPKTSSNWIGAILFFIGLVGAFFYFKTRRTKK